MRDKLVVGNWKMNGGLKQNDALLGTLRAEWDAPAGRRLAVCVPHPYLWQAQAALSGSAIAWGAQNVSERDAGAFTGEVSAAMVSEFGCRYAIVGHSERRTLLGETDAMVASKAAAAIRANLTPIVCVGETLAERDAGSTERVVARQLDAVIETLGTGRTASPQQAQDVHRLLRSRLAAADASAADVLLLYGGSVKGDNAAALFRCPDIDGGLIGGASLKADEFLAIARA